MRDPIVSIGLPVFNGERYLRQALDSLLGQDFQDFELIISDNASTDRTAEICRAYVAKDRRIRYYRNESNIGSARNYRRLFELARGEFFKWCSHDDVCHASFLTRCLDTFEFAPPSVVLVYPQCVFIGEYGEMLPRRCDSLESRNKQPFRRLAKVIRNVSNGGPLWGLIRKESLRGSKLTSPVSYWDDLLLAELSLLGEIWELAEVHFQVRCYHGNAVGICSAEQGSTVLSNPNKASRKTRKALLVWTDPSSSNKTIWLPIREERCLEYFKRVNCAPLPLFEKLLCYLTVLTVSYWRVFAKRAGRWKQVLLELIRRSKSFVRMVYDDSSENLGGDPEVISKPVRANVRIARREEKLRGREGKAEKCKCKSKRKKIIIFGNFGTLNFGNEATFQTVLYHRRRRLPEAEVACICLGPESIAATYRIEAVPISSQIVKSWNLRNPLARFLRKLFIGAPSELYRWLKAFKTFNGTDLLIIPGTGLLTDAYGLFGWGPYNLFKWTAMAKLRRCKVLFVSVGAGPIYGTLGKYLVRSALSLADFRSYRDESSRQWLKGIGFRADNDQVYPDLVFSLPETVIPRQDNKQRSRSVVGLGLMEYAGRYSVAEPSNAIYLSYLENLVLFVKWLLAQDYDVRLLIGDDYDNPATQEFRSLLSSRLGPYDEKSIIDQPISSAQQLLSQLAATNIVVATRFHNILLALLLNKPVISISFHHKCTSLMSEMGLLEYCHDINHMHADRLIEQFQDVERNAEKLKTVIRQKVEQFRNALDEQYNLIFNGL